jgi:hypothetical protein
LKNSAKNAIIYAGYWILEIEIKKVNIKINLFLLGAAATLIAVFVIASPASAAGPVGHLDIADCDIIEGWVYDPDVAVAPISFHVYKDGPAGNGGAFVLEAETIGFRPDVNTTFGITGNHGFRLLTPYYLKDGMSHTIFVHGIDTSGNPVLNFAVTGSGKSFNCPAPKPAPPPIAPSTSLKYYGYDYVYSEADGIDYLADFEQALASGQQKYNNMVSVEIGPSSKIGQILISRIKHAKMKVKLNFSFGEKELFSSADRSTWLQRVKIITSRETDLIKYVWMIEIGRSLYSQTAAGRFDAHPKFVGLTDDQKLSVLKQSLEDLIAEVKKYFPNIPVRLVDAHWDWPADPPANADILGLAAYFTPTVPDCGSAEKSKFNAEVLNVVNVALKHKKPLYLTAPAFEDDSRKFLTGCQMAWYYDLAKAVPDVVGLDWFAYAPQVNGVTGFRDKLEVRQYLDELGKKIVSEATEPEITSNLPPVIIIDRFVRGEPEALFEGWAFDPDEPANPIQIDFYRGEAGSDRTAQIKIGCAVSAIVREDVNRVVNINGSHGFKFTVPKGLAPLSNIFIYPRDPNDPSGFSDLPPRPDPYPVSTISRGPGSSDVCQGQNEIRHFKGSLVNENGTVYFMGAQLRYPFPTEEIFFSWGHKFADVLPANKFDLSLPIGDTVQLKP